MWELLIRPIHNDKYSGHYHFKAKLVSSHISGKTATPEVLKTSRLRDYYSKNIGSATDLKHSHTLLISSPVRLKWLGKYNPLSWTRSAFLNLLSLPLCFIQNGCLPIFPHINGLVSTILFCICLNVSSLFFRRQQRHCHQFQFYFRSYEPFISAFCTYIVSNIVSCAPNKLRAVKHAVDGKSPCRPIWTPKTTLITLTYRTTNSSNYHSEHRSLKVSLWTFPEYIVCLSIAQPHKKEVRSTTV